MALSIRSVEYFNSSVRHRPGAAYEVLSQLASAKVNLLAFSGVPTGVDQAQLVIFPDNVREFTKAAEAQGLVLLGPIRALLVQGDDKLGAFADIHRRLSEAQINVYAPSSSASCRSRTTQGTSSTAMCSPSSAAAVRSALPC